LTEAVLPDLPLRQFVFTFPFALRYRLAFDPDLCAAVRRTLMRALFAFYRRRGQEKGLASDLTGAVAVTQRFGSALNLNIHFHILCFDGLFIPATSPGDRPGFRFLGTPSVAGIQRLLATCRRRIERLLAKRGIYGGADAGDDPADQDPELAACLRDSVIDRQRRHRRTQEPRAPRTAPSLVAHEQGYSLHAETAIPGHDSHRRSALIRYLLRPPFAHTQLSTADDGRLVFRLSHAFDDGTTHVVWTPDTFLSRLAALIPRPRRHLLTYHGVLAPNHALRAQVVRKTVSSPQGCASAHRRSAPGGRPRRSTRLRSSHEQLLIRAYGFFFRRCDRCGGDKRVLAVITDPAVIRAILAAVGLPQHPPSRAPPAA
jgi:hypothetical protein